MTYSSKIINDIFEAYEKINDRIDEIENNNEHPINKNDDEMEKYILDMDNELSMLYKELTILDSITEHIIDKLEYVLQENKELNDKIDKTNTKTNIKDIININTNISNEDINITKTNTNNDNKKDVCIGKMGNGQRCVRKIISSFFCNDHIFLDGYVKDTTEITKLRCGCYSIYINNKCIKCEKENDIVKCKASTIKNNKNYVCNNIVNNGTNYCNKHKSLNEQLQEGYERNYCSKCKCNKQIKIGNKYCDKCLTHM